MKGQIAIEFLMYSSMFILFFLIISYIFSLIGSSQLESTFYYNMFEIGERISITISTVLGMGPGSCYSFSIPTTINGQNYTLILISNKTGNGNAIIDLGDDRVYSFLIPSGLIHAKSPHTNEIQETNYGETTVITIRGARNLVFKTDLDENNNIFVYVDSSSSGCDQQ